jgi:hypothetical protein
MAVDYVYTPLDLIIPIMWCINNKIQHSYKFILARQPQMFLLPKSLVVCVLLFLILCFLSLSYPLRRHLFTDAWLMSVMDSHLLSINPRLPMYSNHLLTDTNHFTD